MDVFELVAYTLKQHFPDIPVKRELQDDSSIELPSFFVQQLETHASIKLGMEQMRKYTFDVVYLVDQHDMPIAKQSQIQNELLNNLVYLVDEKGVPKLKVNDLDVEIREDDLHATFSVVSRVQQEQDALFTDSTEFTQKGNFK